MEKDIKQLAAAIELLGTVVEELIKKGGDLYEYERNVLSDRAARAKSLAAAIRLLPRRGE
jgi:hypothetical protein